MNHLHRVFSRVVFKKVVKIFVYTLGKRSENELKSHLKKKSNRLKVGAKWVVNQARQ